MSVEAVIRDLKSKIQSASLSRRVKFDLGDDGVLLIDGGAINVGDGDADVTLTLTRADLEEILAGDLNPQMAFMSGRLKIAGDMSLAMQLASILS